MEKEQMGALCETNVLMGLMTAVSTPPVSTWTPDSNANAMRAIKTTVIGL